jgi:murein DD-endopeptidase MepM/ murein hydrolase activator NlpD
VLAPSPVAEVKLAGGPEGESPIPGSGPNVTAEASRRPGLATVAVVPSPRIALAIERLREKELLIPVAGVAPSRIEDSFTEQRDGGERKHNALDILAPRNTPILAADDGTILRMSTNALGGITIYATDRDHQFVYYYAHLDHYQRGLTAGRSIQKGDTLGFVGTTGNAPKDVPHLHFQIMLWPSDGKWWNGEPVNPYPVLHSVTPSGGARLRFD